MNRRYTELRYASLMALESTVWMVHVGTGPAGIKGRLALEAAAIAFHPDAGTPETTFQLRDVARARRVWGSPVFELRLRRGSGPSIVDFYFIEPPPLPAGGSALERHSVRRTAVVQLLRRGVSSRAEIGQWVKAVRRGRGDADAGD